VTLLPLSKRDVLSPRRALLGATNIMVSPLGGELITTLAAIHWMREFAKAGGLMAYGSSIKGTGNARFRFKNRA
jgi:hypothetical protein